MKALYYIGVLVSLFALCGEPSEELGLTTYILYYVFASVTGILCLKGLGAFDDNNNDNDNEEQDNNI